jgi:hypothetical protein
MSSFVDSILGEFDSLYAWVMVGVTQLMIGHEGGNPLHFFILPNHKCKSHDNQPMLTNADSY